MYMYIYQTTETNQICLTQQFCVCACVFFCITKPSKLQKSPILTIFGAPEDAALEYHPALVLDLENYQIQTVTSTVQLCASKGIFRLVLGQDQFFSFLSSSPCSGKT